MRNSKPGSLEGIGHTRASGSHPHAHRLQRAARATTTTGIMRQFDSEWRRQHSVLWKTRALDMIHALNSNFRKRAFESPAPFTVRGVTSNLKVKTKKPMTTKFKLILGGILLLFGIIFAMQNSTVVEVRFRIWSVQMSQALVIFLTGAVGTTIGFLFGTAFKIIATVLRPIRKAVRMH